MRQQHVLVGAHTLVDGLHMGLAVRLAGPPHFNDPFYPDIMTRDQGPAERGAVGPSISQRRGREGEGR